MDYIEREILLSFWKVHILHHASKAPVIGHWIIGELRRHGYEVSPGTLYPMLLRMEQRGWLTQKVNADKGAKARKEYLLTKKGHKILTILREQIIELHREVVLDDEEENLS
ncbi:MAG: helix-turn-helix transcriptional regulator [Oligoflexia bacterium]|nr:helix-turn-helix transcriptional regulator [Oligoflexia bacterium]MBF0367777.1 helix-turn-helix transcriptional regulator [Oligoflexia bacterium]